MNDSPTKTDFPVRQVRVKRPERQQIEWRDASLDQLIPRDHRVRAVWAYVDSLDLQPLYQKIQAVEGGVGRDAVDPKILMALWLFATVEAVSSARHLDRLCTRDLPYMWLCGGVGVNYHMLSDFRTAHGEFLDQLLTDTIATLMHQNIVTLETVAQDGMRVRASAGRSSFRRQKTLEKCRQEAAEQVQKLKDESDDDSDNDGSNVRRKAAQRRAASELSERVERALEELVDLQRQKEKRKKGDGQKARCSTTDAEARNMKMGDGGFRPAYNVQFATDGGARVIVSVDVTNNGSDGGQMLPMHEDVCRRHGKTPDNYLVDGGFSTTDDITKVEQSGSVVLAPMTHEDRIRKRGGDPHAPRKGDTDEMSAFRERMATDEAKTAFKQRPSIAEFPNAECRNRGLQQFRVRGLEKVRTVSLWYAITFNFMRMRNLGVIR
ncbi:MAG TPA: IS1182 family transposase [Fuerstia sp.]|jgi:transposase|nr:IS1182 family transposase [Fuerstiella sp.]